MPSAGTDNGFGSRIAAVRFAEFSAHASRTGIVLGGEAVLTGGAPRLDLQAAGGLYDSITLQVFPAAMSAVVQSALPVLTAANLCDALGREQHVDPADRRFRSFTAAQRQAIAGADRMGNVRPKLLRCDVVGDTVTFEKESQFDASGNPRHIYGAIRFLKPPYSSFQLIRGSADAPGAALLQRISTVVNSWRRK